MSFYEAGQRSDRVASSDFNLLNHSYFSRGEKERVLFQKFVYEDLFVGNEYRQ